MMIDHIKTKLEATLKAHHLPAEGVAIEKPVNAQFGDYSSNIAFRLSKQLKKSPFEIAADIAAKVETDDVIAKAEPMKPGFINFWLTTKTLFHMVSESLQKGNTYGYTESLKGKRVMTEYTDPNPFKEFHIGHLYSNIVGESLSRLYESQGAEVIRVTYQGDVGLHVAKSLWGIKKIMEEEHSTLESLSQESLTERVRYMGRGYALGAAAYETDETAKSEINILNKLVYQKDASIKDLYLTGRQWSLDYFELIYRKLGSHFKHNFFESDAGPRGIGIVKCHIQDGVFEESNGAIIFPGEKYGLHTRVFINSQGLPTYEAKELGLAPSKQEKFPHDISLIITANEIKEYFKVLLKALSLIDNDLAKKTTHLTHGMVRLPEGKMSSRTGNILSGEWLLNEAEKAAKTAFEKVKENTQSDKGITSLDTAEPVGIAAVKYALLKNSIGHDVEFHFSESVSFEGNSGPYLLYSYVRCQSILEKGGSSDSTSYDDELNLSGEEYSLMRLIAQFPETVAAASAAHTPNMISNYLYTLAQAFNLFYQKHSILKSEGATKTFRLSLTKSVATVLKNGLYLLGIQTVEKM